MTDLIFRIIYLSKVYKFALMHLFPWFDGPIHDFKKRMGFGKLNCRDLRHPERIAAGEFVFKVAPFEQYL